VEGFADHFYSNAEDLPKHCVVAAEEREQALRATSIEDPKSKIKTS
jgi:hypothetical protein